MCTSSSWASIVHTTVGGWAGTASALPHTMSVPGRGQEEPDIPEEGPEPAPAAVVPDAAHAQWPDQRGPPAIHVQPGEPRQLLLDPQGGLHHLEQGLQRHRWQARGEVSVSVRAPTNVGVTRAAPMATQPILASLVAHTLSVSTLVVVDNGGLTFGLL